MAKFKTNECGATWWPNVQPMQLAFSSYGSNAWIRCAFGNVLKKAEILFWKDELDITLKGAFDEMYVQAVLELSKGGNWIGL